MSEDEDVMLNGEQVHVVDVKSLPPPSDPNKVLLIGSKDESLIRIEGTMAGPMYGPAGCMVALKYGGEGGWTVIATIVKPKSKFLVYAEIMGYIFLGAAGSVLIYLMFMFR